jgi:hypothetical protein
LVNLHAQFARRPDGLLGGLQQCILDSADEDITVDALFALPEFQDGQKICVHILINGVCGTASGEQKSRKIFISDFRALAEPADFTILEGK